MADAKVHEAPYLAFAVPNLVENRCRLLIAVDSRLVVRQMPIADAKILQTPCPALLVSDLAED